jgi:hypothetical protein
MHTKALLRIEMPAVLPCPVSCVLLGNALKKTGVPEGEIW